MNGTASKLTWPIDHLESVKARLKEACGWFELEAPAVQTNESGEVSLDGPLTDFLHREGINLDWIFCGEVESLARHFRDNRLCEKEFLAESRLSLSTGEKKALLASLKLVIEEKLDVVDALIAWREAVTQTRSKDQTQQPKNHV